MPTGCTYAVQQGKITTLRDFALQCSRAFGALISMREESLDAEIPRQIEPDTAYYDSKIAASQTVLAELADMPLDEAERRARAEFDVKTAEHAEYVAEKATQAQRYRAMIDKVQAWEVPQSLAELRSFMLDQLCRSMDADCGYEPKPPVLLDGATWRSATHAQAMRDLEYCSEKRAESLHRAAEANAWLRDLWATLEPSP